MVDIKAVIDICQHAFDEGGLIMVCGNGGSAAESSHLAAELMGKGLPCISLAADTAVLTALANDYGYEQVFSRQVEALGQKGDVLIVLSTSGKSDNVLNAVTVAERVGVRVVALPCDGGDTKEIQENHLRMIHQLAESLI